jgi:two-component system KDP operon response regulator KdpE
MLLIRSSGLLRGGMIVQEQGGEPYFKSGTLTVDLVRRIVMVKGEEVRLSPKEYDILRLLVLRAGRVLTHNFLMQEVWGIGCQVQYLRIYVRQLRQKIEPEPERPIHIITETGVGYRLRVHDNGEGLQPVSKQGGQ